MAIISQNNLNAQCGESALYCILPLTTTATVGSCHLSLSSTQNEPEVTIIYTVA